MTAVVRLISLRRRRGLDAKTENQLQTLDLCFLWLTQSYVLLQNIDSGSGTYPASYRVVPADLFP
jgi:hypothetical protein